MSVVSTVPERCQRCYCCVRECPANAIQIDQGQAVVLQDRCIGCGNCLKVCTQKAKAVVDSASAVASVLAGTVSAERVALIAPSFPAAFPSVDPLRVIGALRQLGFTRVVEVAFGADLVSDAYNTYLRGADAPVITTPCPAIVEYIEKYHPALLSNLAPVVSPMIAAGKVVRQRYGSASYNVFIGPCVAKKLEAMDPEVGGVIDEALTFDELQRLFASSDVDVGAATPSDPDPPRSHLGQIYPVPGGLVRSAGIGADIMNDDTLVVEGRQRCLTVINEMEKGTVNSGLVDILFCEGCINGPGMTGGLNHFEKRERIVDYVKEQIADLDMEAWKRDVGQSATLSLERRFRNRQVNGGAPADDDILHILQSMGKGAVEKQLNCGACGYDTCRAMASAVAEGIAEREMCLQYTIDNLERSHRELAETQSQLIQSEKLASVGQLAAGVAHEINNPLGSILLYSHLLIKQLEDSDEKKDDVRFIVAEAERCKNIVSNLLDFARQGKLTLGAVTARELLDGACAAVQRREDFHSVRVEIDAAEGLPQLYVDVEQMQQVLYNLAFNACEAMNGSGMLRLSVAPVDGHRAVTITVSDTGCGIAPEHQSRLFTPFFTTKGMGKGTGLGLSIAYGIVKLHHGQISVHSEVGTGSTFTITIPSDLRGRSGDTGKSGSVYVGEPSTAEDSATTPPIGEHVVEAGTGQ